MLPRAPKSAKVPTGASKDRTFNEYCAAASLFAPHRRLGLNVEEAHVRSPRCPCHRIHLGDAEEGGRGVGDGWFLLNLNSTGRHGGEGVVAVLQRAACSVQVVVATTLAPSSPGPMNAAAVAQAL